MAGLQVGIIGCGRQRSEGNATGFGMAHLHAAGYMESSKTKIVAAADIDRDNLDAFVKKYGIPNGYTSAEEMLQAEKLDVVSICLWPHLHAPMVQLCAEHGVGAIHCEKPMAPTYGEALSMVEVCDKANVQLTFNHQRRFGGPYARAKELADSGAVGAIERIEAYTSNLFDWGTHWFDMMLFYSGQKKVKWVMGQCDARGGREIFGVPVEGQGMSLFMWEDGVMGLLITDMAQRELKSTGCFNRIIGSDGVIEIGVTQGPALRYKNIETGGKWEIEDADGDLHGGELVKRGIFDLVDSLETGKTPMLSGYHALQASELIFATYESSRLRQRVDLPLCVTDSPLLSMLDDADVTGWPSYSVRANGINIRYLRGGAEGKTVVFAHGFSDSGLCWSRVARKLQTSFDVIMYDARGHGLSEAPEKGYSQSERALDLIEFVKALELDSPVVFGHSMGAATAATAAAREPELFGALVLEDPPWFAEEIGRNREHQRQADAEKRRREITLNNTLSKEHLMKHCGQENPNWHSSEIGPWAESKQQLSPNVIQIFGEAQSAPNQSWQEIAKAISCPTLLLTAEHGLVTEDVEAAACGANGAISSARISGAGHSIRRDAFSEYMDAVGNFLGRVT